MDLPDEKIVLPARTSSFDLPHSALVGRAYQHGVRLERTRHDSLAGYGFEFFHGLHPAVYLIGIDQQFDAPLGDVDSDAVAVAHDSDLPAGRCLRPGFFPVRYICRTLFFSSSSVIWPVLSSVTF